MSKNTGGPAFPMMHKWEVGSEGCEVVEYYAGMTLRDYFAAKAMQGLLASPKEIPNGQDGTTDYYAMAAYAMADAMIAERGKGDE